MDRVFVDTNVLIYADDDGAGKKQKRARALLAELIPARRAVLSTQVLAEYFVVATKKLSLPADRAQLRVDVYAQLDVVIIRPEFIQGAIAMCRLKVCSFWDALVVKSAAAAGCHRLLSEDFNHGQLIDGVRIENPFLG